MFSESVKILTCIGFIALSSVEASAMQLQEDWVQRFNGADNRDDFGESIAVDEDGNIIVVGSTFEQVGSNLFAPRVLTLKYDGSGVQQWAKTFDVGGTWSTSGHDLVVDAQRNVFIAASVFGGEDWAALKYDASGTLIWSTIYQANSFFVSAPEDIEVDVDGRVYLAGNVGDLNNGDFAGVVRFDPSGAIDWVTAYRGPESLGSVVRAIEVDRQGNVYVVGVTVVSGRSGQASIVKLDASGDVVWQKTFGYPTASGVDAFNDLGIDAEGNIVVTGFFGSNTSDGPDLVVYKFDANGNELWNRVFGQLTSAERGLMLEIDSEDTVYVAGYEEVGPNDLDIRILKYDSNGGQVWDMRYGGTGLKNDTPRAMAFGRGGNLVVASAMQPFAGVTFYHTAEIAPSGTLVADALYGGPLDGGSVPTGLAIAPDGTIYVTGQSAGDGTGLDAATIRYSSNSGSSPASLTDVQVAFGSLVGGGLVELESSDDLVLEARSQFGFSATEPNIIDLVVGAVSPLTTPSELTLTIENRLNNAGGSANVRLKNFKTGAFESVGTYAVGTTEVVRHLGGLDAAHRVRPSDERIECSVRISVIATFSAAGFDAFFDQVLIEVR